MCVKMLLQTKNGEVMEKEKLENLLNEVVNGKQTVIGIDENDIKNCKTIDGFIFENKDGIDLAKKYLKQYGKIIKKIEKPNQVVISILAGPDVMIDKIYKFINSVMAGLPKDVGVIFGMSIDEHCAGIYKVTTIFQLNDKIDTSKQIKNYKDIAINDAFIQNYDPRDEENDSVDEELNFDSFESRIDEFCKFDLISASKVQKYFDLDFPTAVRLLQILEFEGLAKRDEKHRCWIVLNKDMEKDSLKDVFIDKL